MVFQTHLMREIYLKTILHWKGNEPRLKHCSSDELIEGTCWMTWVILFWRTDTQIPSLLQRKEAVCHSETSGCCTHDPERSHWQQLEISRAVESHFFPSFSGWLRMGLSEDIKVYNYWWSASCADELQRCSVEWAAQSGQHVTELGIFFDLDPWGLVLANPLEFLSLDDNQEASCFSDSPP